MRIERAFAGSIALGLSLTFVPLGCGAGKANEEYTVVNHPSSGLATPQGWSISEPVVEKMQACAKAHAHEFATYNHEAKFDLRVTDGG